MITVSGDRHVKSKKAALVAAFFMRVRLGSPFAPKGGLGNAWALMERAVLKDEAEAGRERLLNPKLEDNTMTNPRWMSAITLTAALSAMPLGAFAQTSVQFATGGTAVIGGGLGYQATLDDAAVVWDLSNGANGSLPIPGSGPQGLIGGLNILNVSQTRQAPAKLTEVMTTWGARVKVTVRAQAQLFLPGESANLNVGTGAIQTVAGAGGVLWSAVPKPGLADGGEVSISHLRVDLVNKLVRADLVGTPLVESGQPQTFTWADVPLFSFSSVSGVQGLSAGAVAAGWGGDVSGLAAEGWVLQSTGRNALGLVGWAELQGLKVTDQALVALEDSLGVLLGSTPYNYLASLNTFAEGWGKLRVGLGVRVTDLNFNDGNVPGHDILAPVRLVPEPGTYALMGLGLVGLAWVRARHRV